MATPNNLIIACSSGPSLADHFDTIRSMMPCKSVVAVNRAGEAIAANWWVFLDWQVPKLWLPASPDSIHVTKLMPIQRQIKVDPPFAKRMAGRSLADINVCFPHLPPQGKVSHSGIAGVAWSIYVAMTCGIPEIHLFGFDMAGTRDFRNTLPNNTNSPTGHGRPDARWVKERARIAKLTRFAQGCGIRIKRWKKPT